MSGTVPHGPHMDERSAMADTIRRIGELDFTVVRKLGAGGFGCVFEVVDQSGNRYAIKSLKSETARHPKYGSILREAFLNEIIMWLQLGPLEHIAHAVRRHSLEGQDFLVLELVDGIPLDRLIFMEPQRRLSRRQVLDVGVQFCQAMVACAESYPGFVHADVKPDNIMLTRTRCLKLIDFGLSRGHGLDTIIGQFQAGAAPFQSPALKAGAAPSVSSDLWAFGVSLGMLLWGRPAETIPDALAQLPPVVGALEATLRQLVHTGGIADFSQLEAVFLRQQLEYAAQETAKADSICSQCGYAPTQGATSCPLCEGGLVAADRTPEFVHIPAGTYRIGHDRATAARIIHDLQADVEDSFLPELHEITIGRFRIGKYPVMNRQYAQFVEDRGYRRPPHWAPGDSPYPAPFADHPVVGVSFHDIEAYCEWLRAVRDVPARLPSPVEWEVAARGEKGLIYPWGDTFDADKCRCPESGSANWDQIGTVPVGSFPGDRNPVFGIEDMGGNVREWAASYNPNKPLCGGAWNVSGKVTSVSFIHTASAAPDYTGFDCGFRVAFAPSTDPRKHAIRLLGIELRRIPPCPESRPGCPPRLKSQLTYLLDQYGYEVETLMEKFAWGRIVRIPLLYLAGFPVTNEQYALFVRRSGHRAPAHWNPTGDPYYPATYRDHPVVGVDFKDALAFCAWLGSETGKHTPGSVRLASAEEWSHAATGGRGEDRTLYPWNSDEFDEHRCKTVEYPNTAPVTAYLTGASPYGAHHMAGNVWEFVKDEVLTIIALKGGSWKNACRRYGIASVSVGTEVDYRENDIGFRIAAGSKGT